MDVKKPEQLTRADPTDQTSNPPQNYQIPVQIPPGQKNKSGLFAALLLILLFIGGVYFLYIKGYLNLPQTIQPGQPGTIQCNNCTKTNEESCTGGSSCFVPEGLEMGYCVPNPKPGQVYTNEQIENICNLTIPVIN